MGKVSLADKMQSQTLSEQHLGAKAIMAAHLDKGWALSTVKICQRVDRIESATERKGGCDWCCSLNIFERWKIGRWSR